MPDLIAALGLVLVIEGLTFAAFPAATRRALETLLEASDGNLRITGIVAGIVGVVMVWLVRG